MAREVHGVTVQHLRVQPHGDHADPDATNASAIACEWHAATTTSLGTTLTDFAAPTSSALRACSSPSSVSRRACRPAARGPCSAGCRSLRAVSR